jgi:transcriptional regulator with XRE-family HTH domain
MAGPWSRVSSRSFSLARPAAVADGAGEMKQPSLGDKVRAHRESAGITLRELGRQAGVSPSFICDLEAGRRHPGPANLRKIAKVLGLAYTELEDLDHRRTLSAVKKLMEKTPAWVAVFREIEEAASEGRMKPEDVQKKLRRRK